MRESIVVRSVNTHLRGYDILISLFIVLVLVGCSREGEVAENAGILQITTTSNIVADIVGQIGGEHIQQTTLIPLGADPHSYLPTPADLVAIAQADIIFINGFGFEQTGFIDQLVENAGNNVKVIAVSEGIAPLSVAETDHDHEDEHGTVDPHVWFNPDNVRQWVSNIQLAFITRDPSNSDYYEAQANAYFAELDKLEADITPQLEALPVANRLLVTNHDSFAYFAEKYGFTLVGTVIPASSTAAEPSAGILTQLIADMEANNVCTIFTETTINDSLAQTVAAELAHCDKVQVLPLYTGSLGAAGSGADTYLGMFRTNVETIITGLKP